MSASTGSFLLEPTAHAFARDLIRFAVSPSGASDVGTADAWVARLLASLLWLMCLSVTLGLIAALAGRLPGAAGRLARRGAVLLLPRALVRIAAGACGFTIALSPLVAAAATPSPAPATATSTVMTSVPGPPPSGPPSWPTDPPVPSPVPASPVPASPVPASAVPATPVPTAVAPTTGVPATGGALTQSAGDTVTVRPGDSLWLISARRLASGATPQQIAEQWPALYRANSDVIGRDPDHITPGEILRLPAVPPA